MRKTKLILLNMLLVFFGISVMYGITVLTFVSAQTPYIIDYVPIESVEITTDSKDFNLHSGDSVNLSVVLTPYYAIETAQEITYEIVGGFSYATIENDILTINKKAKIGAKVTVKAFVDKIESSNSLVFTIIEIPVKSILILNTEEYIIQNGMLQIETDLLPTNATNQKIRYTITIGQDYARITDSGLVIVNSNLPRNDAVIIVKATSDYDKSFCDIKEFKLYVPTTNLSVKADKDRICPGDTFNLVPILDSYATKTLTPRYKIVAGEQYISDFNGKTVTLVDTITDYSPSIIVKINYADLEAEATLDIYIPATEIEIFTDKIKMKQGETITLKAILYPENATRDYLVFSLAKDSNTFAEITNNSLKAMIINDNNYEEKISVVAIIDNLISEKLTITIIKPEIVLQIKDETQLFSSSLIAGIVEFKLLKDNELVTSEYTIHIEKGNNFGLIEDNKLLIKNNIVENNSQITLYAKFGNFISQSITREINILTNSISIDTNIREVEQNRKYTITSTINPFNASNKLVSYELLDENSNKLDDSYATIDSNGQLIVFNNIPIGTKIIIKAYQDNIDTILIVTVKIVYAENISVNYIKRNGTIVNNDNRVRQGDILTFNVQFGGADNISDDIKVYYLELDQIYKSFAKVSSDRKSIEIESSINEQNPIIKVVICSNQNGSIISCEVDVEIIIYIEKIVISATKLEINENEEIMINKLLIGTYYPIVADITNFEYIIESGNDIAIINDGNLKIIKSNLSKNNRTFTISATAKYLFDNITIKTVQISVYINTKKIEIERVLFSGFYDIEYGSKAVSMKEISSLITVVVCIDSNSTNTIPDLIINKGFDLVKLIEEPETNEENRKIIYKFKIIENISTKYKNLFNKDNKPRVSFYFTSDGKNSSIETLDIYVPTEKVSFKSSYNRNDNLVLYFNDFDNDYISNYVSDNIWEINLNKNDSDKFITKNDKGYFIKENAKTGDFNISGYRIVDNRKVEFNIPISINPLITTSTFTPNIFYNISTENANLNGFSIIYSEIINSNFVVTDSIYSFNNQIREGHSTNIILTYNGLNLSEYGITYYIQIISGSEYVNLSDNKLSVKSGVNDSSLIKYKIIIIDGPYTYTSNIIELKVFKEYNIKGLSSIIIEKETTQLTKEIFKNGFDLLKIIFNTQDTEDFSLTSNGVLKIKTDKLNPKITFTVTQNYNNISISKEISKYVLDLNTNKIFGEISAKIKYDLNQNNTDVTGSILSKFSPKILTKYDDSNYNSVMIKKGDSNTAICDITNNYNSYYVFNGWMLNNIIVTNSSGTFNKNVSGYISGYKWIYVGPNTITLKASWSKINTYSNYKYVTLASEIQKISNNSNYLLLNNINLKNKTFEVISTYNGIFDGNGYSISGLLIAVNTKGTDDVSKGFVGINKGTIRNIKFENCSIIVTGKEPYNIFVGLVCGYNKGLISNIIINNCSIMADTGTLETDQDFVTMVGGVSGVNWGNIEKCGVTLTKVYGYTHTKYKTAYTYAGGITGSNRNNIENCYVRANGVEDQYYIEAKTGACYTWHLFGSNVGSACSNAGGIAGRNEDAIIVNSLAYYNLIKATNDSKDKVLNIMEGGSLVGHFVNGTINNCYSNSSDTFFGYGTSINARSEDNITVKNTYLSTNIWKDTIDGPVINYEWKNNE